MNFLPQPNSSRFIFDNCYYALKLKYACCSLQNQLINLILKASPITIYNINLIYRLHFLTSSTTATSLLPVNDLDLPDILPAHFSCKVSRTVVSPSKVYNLPGRMSPSLFLFSRVQFRLIGLYYSSTQNFLINCFSCGGSAKLRVICRGRRRCNTI